MPHDEDWLLAPCAANMYRYESLFDGKLDLVDVMRANEYLAVRAENQARAQEAAIVKARR